VDCTHRIAAKARFEQLYGRPLSEDFLITWDLPKGGPQTPVAGSSVIVRPDTECDDETLIAIEEAYVNESRILNITHKGIPSLPVELMGRLTTLTELNLHNNKLSSLPATIGQLSSLTKVERQTPQATRTEKERSPREWTSMWTHSTLLLCVYACDTSSTRRSIRSSSSLPSWPCSLSCSTLTYPTTSACASLRSRSLAL
jgi:Leucine-rich repeat (LRR) protein